MPLIEVSMNLSKVHCPRLIDTLRVLSVGFLLAGIGLTAAGLFICACWGKLVKVSKKAKVAPTASTAGIAVPAGPADIDAGKKAAEMQPLAQV
jgi:hypothetical protein